MAKHLLLVDYENVHKIDLSVLDDGYRAIDETTLDGLPAPVYHLVGDSSSVQVQGENVYVAYQDSTVMQLRYGTRDPMKNTWKLENIAGHATPFKGAYGFYAQNRVVGGQGIVSSYVIDQRHDVPQFFVEVFAMTLQTIIP